MEVHFVIIFNVFLTLTDAHFDLTIIHTGGLRSHVYEMNKKKRSCTASDRQEKDCYGGMARISTKVSQIRAQGENTILVDSGNVIDTGSVWFTLMKGQPAARIMSAIGYNVTLLGRYDYIPGPQVLGNFLRTMGNHCVVASNSDFRFNWLTNRVRHKAVLRFPHNQQVGVIGYVNPTAQFSLTSDYVTFQRGHHDLQNEVSRLKYLGVNKIIALGNTDFHGIMELAKNLTDVDVFVHSDKLPLFYTGEPPSTEEAMGPYPTVMKKKSGKIMALIAGIPDYGKYLGRLNVRFDDDGNVISYSGNPILLDHSVKKDPAIANIVESYRPKVDAYMRTKLADTLVDFPDINKFCKQRECNFGNLVTDALVDHVLHMYGGDLSVAAPIAVINAGAMHGAFSRRSPITVADFMPTLRYRTSTRILTLVGTELKQMLETSVMDYEAGDQNRFLQMSGLWVTYDLRRPKNHRVVDIMVRSYSSPVPTPQPFGSRKTYKVILNQYLAKGGDEYTVLGNVSQDNRKTIRGVDTDIVMEYIKKKSPLSHGIEGRIKFLPLGRLCTGSRTRCSSSLNLFSLLLLNVLLNT